MDVSRLGGTKGSGVPTVSLFLRVVNEFTPGRFSYSSLEKARTFNKRSFLSKSSGEVSMGEIYMFQESIENR